jgi:hypothetical protein
MTEAPISGSHFETALDPWLVMAGLVPAIHAAPPLTTFQEDARGTA